MKKLIFFIAAIITLLHGHRIYAQLGYISTIAGTSAAGYSGDGGTAISAKLYHPTGIWKDTAGNLYIADASNAVVRKVNTSGIITTIAGTGSIGYSGDGGAATSAKLDYPSGVVVDKKGNIYIADAENCRIRKVDTSGIITTIAGTYSGYSGDGGHADSAKLKTPYKIAIDNVGNIYVCDYSNNRIRKIDTSGIITTVAGNGTAGFSGDGGSATSAELNNPTDIAVDNSGNLFIADYGNYRIRKVNTSGTITTFAGSGTFTGILGDCGPDTSAYLQPSGVFVDNYGNVFVAELTDNRIRKINTSGIITTIAGVGFPGYTGDGGSATSAELNGPIYLFVDAYDNIYFGDLNNNVVRKIEESTYIF